MKRIIVSTLACLLATAAWAKIPAPVLDDAAKAKAEEAKAKTAWAGKVEAYQLCKAQDRVAVHAAKTAKSAGKEAKPATATPPCADPGPFVSTLPGAEPAAAVADTKAAKAGKPAKKS